MNNFINLAGVDKAVTDKTILEELDTAGITCERLGIVTGGVKTSYVGACCLWSFRRSWVYWTTEGPGIPPDLAQGHWKTWGTQVRVDGHCGCPSPLEWFHGFAVGHYHIDTQDGLNSFAKLLKYIYKE